MFKYIILTDYNLQVELQQSYFLVDCLHEEISFKYEKRSVPDTKIYPYPLQQKVIIYKKLGNGILKEITLDELIFYIQVQLPKEYKNTSKEVLSLDIFSNNGEAYQKFLGIFGTIDNIKKAVGNLEILFKHDKLWKALNEEEI